MNPTEFFAADGLIAAVNRVEWGAESERFRHPWQGWISVKEMPLFRRAPTRLEVC